MCSIIRKLNGNMLITALGVEGFHIGASNFYKINCTCQFTKKVVEIVTQKKVVTNVR